MELVEVRQLLSPDEVSAETDTEESLSCWKCVAARGFAAFCNGSVAPRSVSPAAILRTPFLSPSSAEPPEAAFVLGTETEWS